MKKPNITEGEWRKATNMLEEAVVVSDNRPIATMYEDGVKNIRDIVQAETNATAISAVPEMFDALIEAHEFILHRRIFEDDENMKMTLEYKKDKIEQALKKAGCEL